MKIHVLQAEVWVPRRLEPVFAFFADAHNLQKITPPWLHFQILTPGEIEMRPGTLIDYRLRIRGLPLHWQSEITAWEPPLRFVDEQRRGPYRTWIHEHRFQEKDGGTLAIDEVRYAVFGGEILRRLFVARDIEKIFAFRTQKLREIFAS